jgi:hypothetical protein
VQIFFWPLRLIKVLVLGKAFIRVHVKLSANQKNVSVSKCIFCVTQSTILIVNVARNDSLLMFVYICL